MLTVSSLLSGCFIFVAAQAFKLPSLGEDSGMVMGGARHMIWRGPRFFGGPPPTPNSNNSHQFGGSNYGVMGGPAYMGNPPQAYQYQSIENNPAAGSPDNSMQPQSNPYEQYPPQFENEDVQYDQDDVEPDSDTEESGAYGNYGGEYQGGAAYYAEQKEPENQYGEQLEQLKKRVADLEEDSADKLDILKVLDDRVNSIDRKVFPERYAVEKRTRSPGVSRFGPPFHSNLFHGGIHYGGRGSIYGVGVSHHPVGGSIYGGSVLRPSPAAHHQEDTDAEPEIEYDQQMIPEADSEDAESEMEEEREKKKREARKRRKARRNSGLQGEVTGYEAGLGEASSHDNGDDPEGLAPRIWRPEMMEGQDYEDSDVGNGGSEGIDKKGWVEPGLHVTSEPAAQDKRGFIESDYHDFGRDYESEEAKSHGHTEDRQNSVDKTLVSTPVKLSLFCFAKVIQFLV